MKAHGKLQAYYPDPRLNATEPWMLKVHVKRIGLRRTSPKHNKRFDTEFGVFLGLLKPTMETMLVGSSGSSIFH